MTGEDSTPQQDRTLVIIPAFNEEARLGKVIGQVLRLLPQADVLVVDDGSSDATSAVAAVAGARVLRLPFNSGYGVALQTAYKHALRHGYLFAAQIDGDGQHEPADIPLLLEVVRSGEADLVLGSRFLGRRSYRAPLLRRAGMGLFRWLTSLLVRQRITDPTSGFQALNRRTIRFYASDVFPVDYPDADVLLMVHRAGLRIRELPVRMYAAADRHSMHSGFKPLYYIFKMFLSIAVTLLRKHQLPPPEAEGETGAEETRPARSAP